MDKPGIANHRFGRLVSHDYFPITLLILANLLIGILIFADYGESWDEQLRFQYAERSLAAYTGDGKSLIDEKGAFYVMLARLAAGGIRFFAPHLQLIQAWHLVHFATFVMAVFFLYRICLKLYGKWTAFGAALLFNTQPVLWGHAFINPKDIPFMSFFLASIALGVDLVDGYTKPARQLPGFNSPAWSGVVQKIRSDWQQLTRKKLLVIFSLGALGFFILLGIVFIGISFQGLLEPAIRSAYQGTSQGVLSGLFARLAENRSLIPVEDYIQKATSTYARLASLYLGIYFLGLLFLAIYCLPGTARLLFKSWLQPGLVDFGRSLVNPGLIAAGIFVGLTTAIRVLGPAAGLLVSLYSLTKLRLRSLPILAAYALIGLLTLYLAWPYLWGAPVSNFVHSLSLASDYPWEGKVLFAGQLYPVTAVPRSYLPTLLGLQTPEITLLLFLVGLISCAIAIQQRKQDWRLPLIAALWFFLPLLLVVLFNPTLYDNFRQFLFILPAAFIFVAAGVNLVIHRIHRRWLILLVLFALIVPNLLYLTSLHPYQYTYYNTLAGGLAGANRRYETDYWASSYQEAVEFLNENSPAGSTILVVGPSHIVARYARPDLQIVDYSAKNPAEISPPFYALINSRFNKDELLFPQAKIVYSTGRAGAVFAVVKQVEP